MSKDFSYPYYDPDFDTHSERIYGPSCQVSIDNEKMQHCTLVKVDRVNKHGVLLLDMVQVFTDMNFQIIKSYISSDANWCMDVFHVQDEYGNKLTQQNVTDYIHQIEIIRKGVQECFTVIEITVKDRPNIFSKISTALADLHCDIVEAHACSHNTMLTCVAYISDLSSNSSIDDPSRLTIIKNNLMNVFQASTGYHKIGSINRPNVKISKLLGVEGTMTCTIERRLHQLMLYVEDLEMEKEKRMVRIESCDQRGYSIVNVECKDRPRLMFDIVCTLTDMEYAIVHAFTSSRSGAIVHAFTSSRSGFAFQEYFIRHINGYTLNTKSEKERLIKCIESAIHRRVCEVKH